MAMATNVGSCGVNSASTSYHKSSRIRMESSARPSLAKEGGVKLQAASSNPSKAGTGIVIVDHGSRRPESNSMFEEFVEMFRKQTGHSIVEAAHMELASPTIEDAFDRCVEQGAERVIISPYFLFPGRHWIKDIPALAAAASTKHPGINYLVTAPIGLHELMVTVLEDRMNHCLSRAEGKAEECEMCVGTGRCRFLGGD